MEISNGTKSLKFKTLIEDGLIERGGRGGPNQPLSQLTIQGGLATVLEAKDNAVLLRNVFVQ